MTSRLSSAGGTWLLLVGLTLLSYLSWLDAGWIDPRVAGSIVIVIALVKAWLIGMRFMELDHAVQPLRLAYAGWVLVVGVVLLTMFALAP